MVNFFINGQAVTGNQAELAYMNWCLALENEGQPVPRTALGCIADFQQGAFRGNAEARARIEQSGIVIEGAL